MAGSSVAPIAPSKRACLSCVIAYDLTALPHARQGDSELALGLLKVMAERLREADQARVA
jgi:hypothetical protein